MNMHETEGDMIVRRAREAVAACQSKENEARRALAEAVKATKAAREKFERAFIENEAREVAKRKAQ